MTVHYLPLSTIYECSRTYHHQGADDTVVKWRKRNEGTITTYAKEVNHLLKRYATDAVIGKPGEELRNFKQSSLTS